MPLPLLGVGGFAAGLADTYHGVDVISAVQASYVFSGKSIGAADARRRVVVLAYTQGGTAHAHGPAALTASAGTWNRRIVPAPNATDTTAHVSIWEALVPAGETIDFTFTPTTASPAICALAWYTHGRGASLQTGGIKTSTPFEVPILNVPDNGMIIAGFANPNSAAITVGWYGAVEDFNAHSATLVRSGAKLSINGAGGSLTVGAAPSAGTVNRVVAEAWGAKVLA